MNTETSTSNLEIVTRRTFRYPRTLVFKAWTDPNHLKNWWGPNGFTNTFHIFDLRPGGTWKFTMHGPEKGNYENEVVFMEIKEPELISWDRKTQPYFQIEARFEEVSKSETVLTWKMIFKTQAERDKLIKYVPEKNEENMDRLEAELANMK